MNQQPLLFSVIICTYQRYDLLEKAIDSALMQTINAQCYDIWVMDNSPASREREAFANQYKQSSRVHYVMLDKPGLSNARNEGIVRSSGRYVVFLDDDAIAVQTWLASYRDAFQETSGKVAAFGGKITPRFEVPPPSWFSNDLATPYSFVDAGPDIFELPRGSTLIGANAAFDRNALVSCGAFNQSLGRCGDETGNLLSGEEDDMFGQLHRSGWQIFYTPFAEVSHFIPASRLTQSWARRRLAWQAVTDQMRNPITEEHVLPFFNHLVDYMSQVPPEHRMFMGLFWDTPDAELFKKQLFGVLFLTKLLLARGHYPKEFLFQDQQV